MASVPVFAGIFGQGAKKRGGMANCVRPLRLLTTFASTSPKGRGKGTAGSFLITPNTLVPNFTA